MGKLQPDYITWTLSVNADGLQKEMLKVRNNTKELKADGKACHAGKTPEQGV
jgi:hypothetical protein